MEKTLGGKREGSEHAQEFLETQIKDYEQRLSAAEDKLAAFKKKNVGLMPSDQGGYFAQLQREVDAAKKAETDLSIAMSRRDEWRSSCTVSPWSRPPAARPLWEPRGLAEAVIP